MFLNIVIFLLLFATALSSILIIKGKTNWERLIGFNLIATKINMAIIVFALISNRTYYLDIALIYVILSYIGIAVLTDFIVDRRRRESK